MDNWFYRTLVNAMKNYATIQEMQEGHMVPEKNNPVIMGMPINKTDLPKATRDRLKKILYEDILKSSDIDQVKVIKDIVLVEKDIYESLLSGNKEYYKPAKIRSLAAYDNPMRIQGIKAALSYNALKDDGAEAIDLTIRNSIDIIKVEITPKTVERIKDSYPDKYQKILGLFSMDGFEDGISSIALPLNEPVPSWIIEFIDFTTIINDNIKNFPFDSIGLHRMDKPKVNYTNIISI